MTASTALTVAIWIGVMLIGGIGSVLRFLVDRSVARRLARTFPYGTLTVNITGAALLGFLAGLALPKDAALLAGTGFVGAYTTFSTWMLETQRLGEDRQMVSALANIVVSVVLGLAAALSVDRPDMNEQCLKLTAYFGERQRAVGGAGRFLADAMLDLFGSHNVATSVMLRGTTSFGPKHEFRCDQSLSLSEDPPVTVAAVDIESKIRSLVDDVTAMTDRGLVTLERARLVTRHSGAEEFGDIDSRNGDAAKLTIYAGRQVRVAGAPAYYTICELLHRHGFAGATVLLGVDGTAHGRRRRARFFGRNVNVPLMIIAVGTPAQVAVAAMELTAALPNPLLTIERVRLCKRDGELFARPQQLPQTDDQGRTLWQKLMVHTAEATHHEGLPIHRALVHRLMQSETARGATALRGIWGFYGDHKPHGDKLFQLVRRVPVTTIIVDTPQAIARSFDIVDELTNWHGLVTSEMVPAAVSLTGSRDGTQKTGETPLARYDY